MINARTSILQSGRNVHGLRRSGSKEEQVRTVRRQVRPGSPSDGRGGSPNSPIGHSYGVLVEPMESTRLQCSSLDSEEGILNTDRSAKTLAQRSTTKRRVCDLSQDSDGEEAEATSPYAAEETSSDDDSCINETPYTCEAGFEPEEEKNISSPKLEVNGEKISEVEKTQELSQKEEFVALQKLSANGRKAREAESKKAYGDIQETCVIDAPSKHEDFRSYAHVSFGCLCPRKCTESMFGLLCRLHRDGAIPQSTAGLVNDVCSHSSTT